jgi:hypothetical protein
MDGKEVPMTEAEWLGCTHPGRMLRWLRYGSAGRVAAWWARLRGGQGQASPGKLRQFAAACYRRAGLLPANAPPEAATALAMDPETAAAVAAQAVADREVERMGALAWEEETRYASTWDPIISHRASAAARSAEAGVDRAAEAAREAAAQCGLLRCLFGNPFRPAALEPGVRAWNGGALAPLAQAIQEGGRFAELVVLADALEAAGCREAAILAHCRGPGEHAPGCWVLDLVLGRP